MANAERSAPAAAVETLTEVLELRPPFATRRAPFGRSTFWTPACLGRTGAWRLVGLVASLVATIFSTPARADFLAGDASAATLSPDGVRKNPANFAFISNGYFDMSPRIYEVNSLFVRYPGFGTVPKETRGISPMSAMSFAPFSVDGAKSRLGFVLTEVLPPISLDFEVKRLPLIILDQLMFLNVKSKVQVRGGIGGAIAFRATDRLGLGVAGNYRNIGLHSSLQTPEDEAEVAAIQTDVTQVTFSGGLRYVAVPGRLAIGISSVLVSLFEVKNSFEGGFAEFAGGDTSENQAGASAQMGKSLLAGMHMMATARLSLRLDFEYTVANASERRFSIVDLEEQPLDAYDTLAVRFGSKLSISARDSLTAGYVYEPAGVGDGERGKDTKTGFGTIDYVPIFVGIEDLKPYQRIVAGFGRTFGRMKGYDRWSVAAGIALQEASRGIDENGELPGAYRQRKLIFPVQVTYRY